VLVHVEPHLAHRSTGPKTPELISRP